MYLTARDVAEYLKMSKRNVYLMTQLKKIPHYKVGKSVRFDQQEIDGWMQSKKVLVKKEA